MEETQAEVTQAGTVDRDRKTVPPSLMLRLAAGLPVVSTRESEWSFAHLEQYN